MYRDLASALEGLVAGEPDAIANMANAAALIWETLPDLNWAGFYRNVGGELVLGPFQGRPACIRIKFGEGVCGVAAEDPPGAAGRGRPRLPGHIACDARRTARSWCRSSATASCIGVLDLDSPKRARFTEEDEAGCVRLAEIARRKSLSSRQAG